MKSTETLLLRVSLSLLLALLPAVTSTAQPVDANDAPKENPSQEDEPKQDGKLAKTEVTNQLSVDAEYKNAFIFGFSHILHLTRDRDTPIGSAIGHRENLLGVFLAFERILHRHVSITFVKPFYFNHERFDSPFEILINGLYRKNKWEPFIAAGMLSVFRVFYGVEDENDVAEKEFSFGLRFVAGFKYFINPRWAVSFEFGYTFVPGSDTIEHELSDSYLGAYFF